MLHITIVGGKLYNHTTIQVCTVECNKCPLDFLKGCYILSKLNDYDKQRMYYH